MDGEPAAARTGRLEWRVGEGDTAAGFGPGLPAAASTPHIVGAFLSGPPSY